MKTRKLRGKAFRQINDKSMVTIGKQRCEENIPNFIQYTCRNKYQQRKKKKR